MQAPDTPTRSSLRTGPAGRQAGLSLWCWIVILALGALLLGTGARCLPVFLEYEGVVKAAKRAALAETPALARAEFDRIAAVEGVYTIKGADLDIEGSTTGLMRVRFAYQREVPIAGPAYLLFKFSGGSQ